jgi:hypothetical protein
LREFFRFYFFFGVGFGFGFGGAGLLAGGFGLLLVAGCPPLLAPVFGLG